MLVVGFAAETNDVIEYALNKLKKKNFDFIVANDVTEKGAGFKEDTNIATIINRDETFEKYPLMDKKELAKVILDKASGLLEKAR